MLESLAKSGIIAKLGLIVVGVLTIFLINIAFFETTEGARMLRMTAEEERPTSFKVAGAVSIASWFAVLYFGRMLLFIGNAF